VGVVRGEGGVPTLPLSILVLVVCRRREKKKIPVKKKKRRAMARPARLFLFTPLLNRARPFNRRKGKKKKNSYKKKKKGRKLLAAVPLHRSLPPLARSRGLQNGERRKKKEKKRKKKQGRCALLYLFHISALLVKVMEKEGGKGPIFQFFFLIDREKGRGGMKKGREREIRQVFLLVPKCWREKKKKTGEKKSSCRGG